MEFDPVNVAIVVFVAVMVVGVASYAQSYLTPASTIDGTPLDEIFKGNLDVKVSENDFVTGGAHTSTNDKLYFYQFSPSSEADGVAITSTAKNIEIMDGGWGYASIHNGDAEYLMAPWMESNFKKQNPRIKEIAYRDLDNDDKNEMVAKIWFGDIQVGAEDPEWTFNINWIDEDVGLADGDPADITGQGTGSGTAFTITWDMSGWTAGDGCVFGKIYFATNDTREGNDIRLEKLRLYGDVTIIGKTSWSAPTSTSGGSVYDAYYFMPVEYTDPFNGILVYRAPQASDELYVSISGKTYMEANNNVTVDLYIEVISGGGATTQVTDSVMISA